MIGNSFHFQPHLLPTLLVVLLVPLFTGLGIWQLERAEQKRNTASLQIARMNQPPLNLNDDATPSASQAEYRTIVATGTLQPAGSILLENRKHQGRQGFQVLTPLRVGQGDRHLLVNRGWVAAESGLTVPAFDTPEGQLTIGGRATVPSPPALRLQHTLSQGPLQKWPYVTLEDYQSWSGLDLFPFVLLQTDPPEQGFVRVWPKESANDAMHTGYALQWFAFAVIALAIWLRLSLVRRPDHQGVIDGSH